MSNIIKVFENEVISFLRSYYEPLRNRKIIVYGSGGYGKMIILLLNDMKMKDSIYCVCDSDSSRWGKELLGIRIEGIQNIALDDSMTVVIASQWFDEIKRRVEEYNVDIFPRKGISSFVEEMALYHIYKTTSIPSMGFVKNWFDMYDESYQKKYCEVLKLFDDDISKKILECRTMFYRSGKLKYIEDLPVFDTEYFDKSYYGKISSEEVYVDCGAYTGDSIVDFINCVNGNYNKIYAFEPDKNNYKELLENTKHYRDIVAYDCATGKEDGKLCFDERGTTGSLLCEAGCLEVDVKPLDNIIDDDVTWIKMDIEGAELDSLKGAERIIRNNKPKLAICLYHKFEDIFEIPLYLKQLVPEYRFIIRHHDHSLWETILYADIY